MLRIDCEFVIILFSYFQTKRKKEAIFRVLTGPHLILLDYLTSAMWLLERSVVGLCRLLFIFSSVSLPGTNHLFINYKLSLCLFLYVVFGFFKRSFFYFILSSTCWSVLPTKCIGLFCLEWVLFVFSLSFGSSTRNKL